MVTAPHGKILSQWGHILSKRLAAKSFSQLSNPFIRSSHVWRGRRQRRQPVNLSPPFRGARRHETVVQFSTVFKLDGPRLRQRLPPKNITTLKKQHLKRLQKNMCLSKKTTTVNLKVDPKIVNPYPDVFFALYPKNTEFGNRFSSRFCCFRAARAAANRYIWYDFRDATLSEQ